MTACRVTSMCQKFLCQSVHEIGFFRVVKGPKYTQENKLRCFTCKVKP